MLPIYFLSILLNGLAGCILAFGKEETETEGLKFSISNETFRLVVGILSFLTGILKILSPVDVEGNVPIVGDLFPVMAGFAGGFILIFEFYCRHNAIDTITAERIERTVKKHRKTAGFSCIGAAVLHFMFYQVIFL